MSTEERPKKSKAPTLRYDERIDRWTCEVRFPDGHKERVKRKDERDAIADLNEKLARRVNQSARPEKIHGATFDDVITAWIQAGCPTPGGRSSSGQVRGRVRRVKDPNTITQVIDSLRTHVAPRRDLDPDQAILPKNQRRRRKPNPKAIGALLVDRTTTERIEEVFDEMAREGLSGSYIYRTWKHLDSALAWGVKTKRNRYNRADECSLPEGKPPKKGRPFSLDEARAFLDAATTDRRYALWITAVMVGQRPGELTGLRWANLDLESDEPSVDVTERAKYERGKYVGQAKPKTGRDGRIGLHSLAVAALLRWRQELIELGFFEPEGFVFPTENGGPHLQGNVRKYLRDVCKKARVDHDRTTYDLRRTFASIADDALQGNLKLVGKVMGHSGRNGERTTAGYISGVRPVISHAVTAFDAFIEEQRKSNEDQGLDAEDNVVESLSAEG